MHTSLLFSPRQPLSGRTFTYSRSASSVSLSDLFVTYGEFALFQLLVRIISVAVLGWNKVSPKYHYSLTAGKNTNQNRMDSIIAGLVLSNFGKLLHVVMVIWDYNDMEFSYLIKMTVFTSNLEALSGKSRKTFLPDYPLS